MIPTALMPKALRALATGAQVPAGGPAPVDPPQVAALPAATPAAPSPATPLDEARDLLEQGREAEALRILRTLHHRSGDRAEAVTLAVGAAGLDPEFRDLVTLADQERDGHSWGRAEWLYWRALQLYPLHPGYLVQYAHCLKEQGKLEDAEVNYRSALALGAAAEDVVQHIAHVHAALGCGDAAFPAPPPRASALPLDLPPSRTEVEALLALLLQRAPRSLGEVLGQLRTAATCREVALRLVRSEEFPAANRDLITLLAQRA